MYKYRISVATPNGKTFTGKDVFKFLFRTDWMDDEQKAKLLMKVFIDRFPGFSVSLIRTSAVTEEVAF